MFRSLAGLYKFPDAAVVIYHIGVVVAVGVFCEEELPALVAVVLHFGIYFLPSSYARHVQIHPCNENRHRLGVELYAIVPLFKHLYKFARVRVEFERRKQALVAFGARAAHKLAEV